jgi:hypothetical protein
LATILGKKIKVGFRPEFFMTQPQPDQPQLQIGLGNQRSILHQLYDLVLTTAQTREELERSWQTLSHEEEREIVRRQLQRREDRV